MSRLQDWWDESGKNYAVWWVFVIFWIIAFFPIGIVLLIITINAKKK
jgi:hypothetical protein